MRVSGDQTKRSQFADAVVSEQLKRTATSDVPIVIFSRDKNFATVANNTPNTEFASELPELLELLGMKDNVDEEKD